VSFLLLNCLLISIKEFRIPLNKKRIPSKNNSTPNQCCGNILTVHFAETPVFLKIILARKMIAKFYQKDNDTPNHDRIKPSTMPQKRDQQQQGQLHQKQNQEQ
jgi:hypothetical protein